MHVGQVLSRHADRTGVHAGGAHMAVPSSQELHDGIFVLFSLCCMNDMEGDVISWVVRVRWEVAPAAASRSLCAHGKDGVAR